MEWWQILLIVVGGLALLLALSALFYKPFFKRFWDIVLSGLAIVLFSPLILVLSFLGVFFMKGNPFFVQKRPGMKNKKGDERIFKLIKFRTMSNAKDRLGNYLSDEKRLNKYGRFLRSTSLDELPELFNVFIGSMSIVGPRPQLVRDMVFMTEQQRRRHEIRPGLSGLAQVNGRNNITWEQKFEYDLEYIKKITFCGDIAIIVKTVFKVLKRSDVVRCGTESDVDFGDWLLSNGTIGREEYEKKQLDATVLLNG